MIVSRIAGRTVLRRCPLVTNNLKSARQFSTTTSKTPDLSLKESFSRSFSEEAHRRDTVLEDVVASGVVRNGASTSSMQHQQYNEGQWTLDGGKIPFPSSNSFQDATDTVLMQKISSPNDHLYGETPRTSLLMELTDRVGILHDVLRYFWKYEVNICRIESRPVSVGTPTGQRKVFDFFVDMEGSPSDENVSRLLAALRPMTDRLLVLDEKQVHWFPRHISELDMIANRTLEAGVDLLSDDHPGFHDPVYRKRRAYLTETALNHTWDKPIPRIDYTPDEVAVWGAVWDRMEDLWEKYACKEYLQSLSLMKQHCGYQRDNIPQQEDISQFLFRRTGFKMRPVAGLLSSRDFLNGLAFRVFFSTQYIRHHSRPLYTPEPDICHELLGHAPMLADAAFADFSQEIGLASLGATDDDIDRLAHCYWHSVEFGLCKEYDESGKPANKAYGAGLLSSFGELEYSCGDHSAEPEKDEGDLKQAPPEIKAWDPDVASRQAFPITTYQPVYFLADSLEDAKHRMRSFCEGLPRPFFALYNAQTDTVHIDRPVVRTKGVPDKASTTTP